MIGGLVAAIIVLALLLALVVPTALIFCARSGRLQGDLTISQDAGKRAIKAAGETEIAAAERVRRKSAVVSGYKEKVRRLRDALLEHPHSAVRASASLDIIASVLSALQDDDDDDGDPGSDHDAGTVPPGDGADTLPAS